MLKLRGLDFYRNRRLHEVKDKITADLELWSNGHSLNKIVGFFND